MAVLQYEKPELSLKSSYLPEKAPDIPALTSLRFLLAMVVVLIHYKRQISNLGMEVPLEQLSNVVTGFFILSGFLLTYQYSYRNSVIHGKKISWSTQISSFWRTRFARLMPTYWFFISISLVTLPLTFFIPDPSLWNLVIVSNIFLVQALFTNPSIYFGLIPPAYSLSSEAIFYFTFPFIMLTYKKWRWWLSSSLVLTIILPIIVSIMNNHEHIVYMFGTCPLTRFIEFFSGILLANLFFRFKDNSLNVKLLPLLEIVAYSSFIYFIYQPFSTGTFLSIKGVPYMIFLLNRVVAIAGYGMLVWSLACQRGFSNKILCSPILVFLGQASYALFLFHDLIVRFILVHKENLFVINPQLLFCIYLILAIGLSSAAFVLVERPWQKWLLNFFFRGGRERAELLKILISYRSPILKTAFLASLIVGAAFFVDPVSFYCAESRGIRVSEAENVAFAKSLTLRKLFLLEAKGDLYVYFKWRSQEEANKARYLSLSAVDKRGKTLWNSTKIIYPKSGIWYEIFKIPATNLSNLSNFHDLAVCVSDKKSAMFVLNGRRDWSDHRLLLSFPHISIGGLQNK